MKKVLTYIGYGLFALYSIGVMFYSLLFQWGFARMNGFGKWILFGWVVPELKAMVWPIFAF
jgi:hypothetical protein